MDERRQGKRVSGQLQCAISLRESIDAPSLIAPVPCLIDNISSRGLGLSLAQIRFGVYHLFYFPQDNPGIFLCLELIPADETPLHLLVEAVWFNRELNEPMMPFQMGVKFVSPTTDNEIKQVKRLLSQGRPPASS